MEKRHPTHVPGYYGPAEQLGQRIGGLRYDINLAIDRALIQEYARQARADRKAGHPQLARLLNQRVRIMQKAARNMERIYNLCRDKPGMLDEETFV